MQVPRLRDERRRGDCAGLTKGRTTQRRTHCSLVCEHDRHCSVPFEARLRDARRRPGAHPLATSCADFQVFDSGSTLRSRKRGNQVRGRWSRRGRQDSRLRRQGQPSQLRALKCGYRGLDRRTGVAVVPEVRRPYRGAGNPSLVTNLVTTPCQPMQRPPNLSGSGAFPL